MRRRDRIVFHYCADHGLPVAWNLAGGYQAEFQRVLDLHHATMEECLAAFDPLEARPFSRSPSMTLFGHRCNERIKNAISNNSNVVPWKPNRVTLKLSHMANSKMRQKLSIVLATNESLCARSLSAWP